MVRTVFLTADNVDQIREMMIASANYADCVGSFGYEAILPEKQMKSSRKRRLENLSIEEKILRKKLKNREAAQTSRDKKKAYMTSLEHTVESLKAENNKLNTMVTSMSETIDDLKKRNEELEEALRKVTVGDALPGSAVPPIPPPQGSRASPAVLQIRLFLLLMTSLWTSIGSKTPLRPLTSKSSRNWLISFLSRPQNVIPLMKASQYQKPLYLQRKWNPALPFPPFLRPRPLCLSNLSPQTELFS